MEQYIKKSALVKEIERRKQDAINNCGGFKSMREHECDSCIVEQYEEMKNIIDTIEAKEIGVDVGSTGGDVCVKTTWDGDKIVSNKAQKGEQGMNKVEKIKKKN